MYPIYDVTKLTDDELLDKMNKAYNYMNYQADLGHNQTVESIRQIFEALRNEHQERLFKKVDEDVAKKNPNELKPIELGKIEKGDKND